MVIAGEGFLSGGADVRGRMSYRRTDRHTGAIERIYHPHSPVVTVILQRPSEITTDRMNNIRSKVGFINAHSLTRIQTNRETNFAKFFSVARLDELVKRLKPGIDALHAASLVAIGDGTPSTPVWVTVVSRPVAKNTRRRTHPTVTSSHTVETHNHGFI